MAVAPPIDAARTPDATIGRRDEQFAVQVAQPAAMTAPVGRPTLQAFGAALHRAVVAERKILAPAMEPTTLALPVTHVPPMVATPLDTTQPRWPDAMMARIEQVRDAQTAPGTFADTRIRLLPDALGPIDIALRREGEAVHVHLAAADPATAKLLADAQPRLAELAEAKGLKLAQSCVDGGTGSNGGERRQPAAPPTSMPTRPAAAPVETATDTRLA